MFFPVTVETLLQCSFSPTGHTYFENLYFDLHRWTDLSLGKWSFSLDVSLCIHLLQGTSLTRMKNTFHYHVWGLHPVDREVKATADKIKAKQNGQERRWSQMRGYFIVYQVCFGQGFVVGDDGWSSYTPLAQERCHCNLFSPCQAQTLQDIHKCKILQLI